MFGPQLERVAEPKSLGRRARQTGGLVVCDRSRHVLLGRSPLLHRLHRRLSLLSMRLQQLRVSALLLQHRLYELWGIWIRDPPVSHSALSAS